MELEAVLGELSVGESAKIIGKTERSVVAYIAEKRLKAKKVGRRWFVDEKSLMRLKDELSRTQKNGGATAPSRAAVVTTPERLACYRLCQKAFSSALWQDEPFLSIRGEVISELGAGYYSFGRKKVEHYGQARAALGSAVALACFDRKFLRKHCGSVSEISDKLIPAISSLMRKMERTRNRED